MESSLERSFLTLWRQLGYGDIPLAREYRFAPPRRFRFDFCHPLSGVAIECEGQGGRHQTYMGFERDAEKYELAASLGWEVHRVTARMLREDPTKWLGNIAAAIGRRT